MFLTYKALNGQAPRSLQDLITPYAPNRALCSQSAHLLVYLEYLKVYLEDGPSTIRHRHCGTSYQFGFRRLTPPPPLKLNSKHFCLVKLTFSLNNSVLEPISTLIGMTEAKNTVDLS